MDNANMLENYKDLLTVKEVAEILRVHKSVVYKLIKENELKAYKFGRQYKCPKKYILERYIKG